MVGVGIFFDITSFFCQAADLYLVLAPPDQGTTILPQGIIGIEISHLSVLFFILLPTAAFQNLLNLHRQTEKQNVRAARGFRIFSGLLRTFWRAFPIRSSFHGHVKLLKLGECSPSCQKSLPNKPTVTRVERKKESGDLLFDSFKFI